MLALIWLMTRGLSIRAYDARQVLFSSEFEVAYCLTFGMMFEISNVLN